MELCWTKFLPYRIFHVEADMGSCWTSITLSHQKRWVGLPVRVCVWQREVETEIGGSFNVDANREHVLLIGQTLKVWREQSQPTMIPEGSRKEPCTKTQPHCLGALSACVSCIYQYLHFSCLAGTEYWCGDEGEFLGGKKEECHCCQFPVCLKATLDTWSQREKVEVTCTQLVSGTQENAFIPPYVLLSHCVGLFRTAHTCVHIDWPIRFLIWISDSPERPQKRLGNQRKLSLSDLLLNRRHDVWRALKWENSSILEP